MRSSRSLPRSSLNRPGPGGSDLTQRRRLAAEFAAIVVGVLCALGVDAWYGRVVDRRLGKQYEERIRAELLDARELLNQHARLVSRNIAHSVLRGTPGRRGALAWLVHPGVGRDE